MPSFVSEEFLKQLEIFLEPHQISTRMQDRISHAKDLWSRGLLELVINKDPSLLPDLVLWPTSARQVQQIVQTCLTFRVPITAFGAGSGVCGAAVPKTGVSLDLQRMNQILTIDKDRSQVICEPGVLGNQLEKQLNQHGFTLGHFPSSIICSTVGGWVATRGAGQCSTRYGKIEDLVQALEIVGSDGRLLSLAYDGRSRDFLQLIIGSEGTLGIITKITLCVRPLPQRRRLHGWTFRNTQMGTKAIAALTQAGLRPAIVRLYDELDSFFSFSRHLLPQHAAKTTSSFDQDVKQVMDRLTPKPQKPLPFWQKWLWQFLFRYPQSIKRCNQILASLIAMGHVRSMLIIGFEGSDQRTHMEEIASEKILRSYGAIDCGTQPGEHWLAHRYEVGFKLPKIFAAGAFVDTMEVATTHSRLTPLYRAVKQALAPDALVLAHFSHVYETGCSIYFTFISPRKTALLGMETESEKERLLALDQNRYDAMWSHALEAVIRHGGTISHHHGIGTLKLSFLAKEHGDSVKLLQTLKQALDPMGIFNPGKMTLPSPASGANTPTIAGNTTLSNLPFRFIHPHDLYCEVDTKLSLKEIERALHAQGLTLGPLPDGSYSRSLLEALSMPLPSEASPGLGTLFERCLRLTVDSYAGVMTFPVNLAPKRATGPDLKAFFLGAGNTFGTIHTATMQVIQIPSATQKRVFRFPNGRLVFQALFQIRDFYDALGPNNIQVLSRNHLLSDHLEAPSKDLLMMINFAGPSELIHAEIQDIEKLCRKFQGTIIADSDKLLSTQLSTKSETAFHHQRFLLAPSASDLEKIWESTLGTKRLCGMHLHGITLCSEEPSVALNTDDNLPSGSDLFKRLEAAISVAALHGQAAPLSGTVLF